MRVRLVRWLPLALWILAQTEESPVETRVEELPDGGRIERTVRVDGGELVEHGPYRRWFPNGQLECEGKLLDGVRVGDWVTWYSDGTRASEGVYRRGLRHRKWSYWHPDGERNGAESGEYHAVFESFASGAPRVEGERRFKFRHGVWRWFREAGGVRCEGRYHNDDPAGTWTWFRPDGSRLWEGELERVRVKGEWISRRTGRWTFRHPNGLVDPGFLSGDYVDGVRQPGSAPLGADLDPGLDPRTWPRPARPPGARTEIERFVARAIETFRADDPERWVRAVADVSAHETVALPLILWTLIEMEVDDELSDGAARRLAELLPDDFLEGDSLRWSGGLDPAARRHDRLVLRRWLTLWELYCARPEELFREREVALDAFVERLVGPNPEVPGPLNAPADCAAHERDLARIAWGPDLDLLARHGGLETEAPVQSLLDRLRERQAADGSWDADLRTTALAALALAAANSSTQRGPHREALAAAAGWIAALQDPGTGALGVPGVPGAERTDGHLVDHALALSAWMESVHGVRDPAVRVRIQASVDHLAKAQDEAGSWTTAAGASATDWVAVLLALAEDRGYRFLGHPFRTALGHFAARRAGGEPGLRETAAALWLEHLQYHEPAEHSSMQRAAVELLEHLPELAGRTDEEGLELWYFGTNAAFQTGGETWTAWNEAMKATLLAEPAADPSASTRALALRALCLEVYTRYRRMSD